MTTREMASAITATAAASGTPQSRQPLRPTGRNVRDVRDARVAGRGDSFSGGASVTVLASSRMARAVSAARPVSSSSTAPP